ncbi:hypothetical protein AVDCRST_MAG81-2867 [uncultured Synechococcales cyanobacterium]|uniref:Uncharacterized protein n=1 Tax=uncultured Synechococcales cyanobacterium TaxID=1936017 RepID=A0A6J4VKK3_9CYAN|nr:hypothetical protein AVDCRST_MAG81-2867 [uncultured Synechococcales cyanobacterium]
MKRIFLSLLLGSLIYYSGFKVSQASPTASQSKAAQTSPKQMQQHAVQALEKQIYSPTIGQGKVTKMVFAYPYALANWQRGERLEMATLVYTPQGWRVISLANRGWGGFDTFIKERNLPPDKAARMLDQIFPDWRKWEK